MSGSGDAVVRIRPPWSLVAGVVIAVGLVGAFVGLNVRGAVRLAVVIAAVVVVVRVVTMAVEVRDATIVVRNPLRSYRIPRTRVARVEIDPTPRLIGVLPVPGARSVLVREDEVELRLDATVRLRFQHAWSYPIAKRLAAALGVPLTERQPKGWWPDTPV